MTGPGFQMAQKFIENVFEKHIDWVALITNNDNYKNILQVKIQKEFKVTLEYLQMDQDTEDGYKMGVFLCIGQPIYNVKIEDAIHINTLNSFKSIKDYLNANDGKIFVFLGKGHHKIKKDAEQIACNEALMYLNICEE